MTRPAAVRERLFARGDLGRHVAAILALAAFALALGLRLQYMRAPLSFDEFASLYFADRPFRELWGWWMVRETNPALFYTTLKVWRMLVPESVIALRILPMAISLAQIGLIAWFAQRQYRGLAGALAILLFALSPSDLFLSFDVRAYGLAKLAVTVSFIGLMTALGDEDARLRGWLVYAGGAVVGIYTHTTMLLWPPVATLAVLVEAGIARGIGWPKLIRLMFANFVIAVLSTWELLLVIAQLHEHTNNIAWIKPLPLEGFRQEVILQLLLQNTASTVLMVVLIGIGVVRTIRLRVTRLALVISVAGILAFKAADQLHPIISDYTLHWAASFTVLLGASALAGTRTAAGVRIGLERIAAVSVLAGLTAIGLADLNEDDWVPQPQDWGYTVRTVARTPGSALLASHESVGLVIEGACRLEFHRRDCPFPLVVMNSPSRADSWALGGYRGRMVPARAVRAALGPARTIFAFSRYVYDPLDPLGLDPDDYKQVEWGDGELIGPIPIKDFEQS